MRLRDGSQRLGGVRRKLSLAKHLLSTRNFNSKWSMTGGFHISHGMFRSVTVADRRSGSGEIFLMLSTEKEKSYKWHLSF